MPTQDKLIQLSLYKQLIEAKFNIEIPGFLEVLVAIPLILKNARPMAVNHFRIGEALFFQKISSQVKHLKGCIMMYLNYTRRLSKLLKNQILYW
jgi:predicted amino acid racemase